MTPAARSPLASHPANGTPLELSDLARAIEAQGRHVRCIPVDALAGAGGKPIGAIAFRVAVKADEDAAIVAAHRYVADEAKVAGEAGAAARQDTDLLGDAKTIEALYRVCMAAEPASDGGWRLRTKPRPDGGGVITYSAFPSPGWMRKNLTTDQIAYLMNLYLGVRAEARPGGKAPLDDETLDALVENCALYASTDVPNELLARLSRDKLTDAFVMVCERLVEKGRAVDALLKERAEGGAPPSVVGVEDTEPPPPDDDTPY